MTGADSKKSEEQIKKEEENAKKEEKEDKEKAQGNNPGKNSPDGQAREKGKDKEENPSEKEKEAKEKVEKDSEKKQKEEKDKEKENKENKGTDADSRKNSPDSNKQEDYAKDEEKSKGKGNKKEIKGDDSRWTLYAQIIMGQAIKTKEKEESQGPIKKAFKGVVSGIIGDGGTTLDIPYTKFSALNKELTDKPIDQLEGGEEGQALASTLATFTQYGYIKSLSGNKLATEFVEFVGDIGRFFGGGIAYICQIFYDLMSYLLEALLKGLVALNPYSLLGFDKGNTALPDNPVSKVMKKFFDAIGLNGEFFTTLTELGFIIIVIVFVLRMMVYLAQTRFKDMGIRAQRMLVSIFVLFAGFPLLFVLSASIAKTANDFIKTTHVTDSPVMSHLVDSRAMASGLNLSPSALKTPGETPHATSEENYIDTKYQPATKASRNRISDINKVAYENLYNNYNEKDISFQLLNKWLTGSNFDVNTYMADLRSNAELPGVKNFIDVYSKGKNLSASDTKKLSRRDLESVIWSSTQNTDGDLRKPDHDNYDPTLKIGVENEASFSTQSVALLLQSSFNSASAKFYSYNIAPKGEQANSKNNSTIKTEWREITMPGDGMFGVFGSWLSLVSKSLTYVLISSAVIMALLSTTFVTAFWKFFKQAFQALFFGSLHSMLATFLLYMGAVGSLLMAVGLPGAFVKFIEGIQSIVFKLTGDNVPSIIVELLGAVVSLIMAYWMSWGGRISAINETPVKALVTFFVEMALDYESRVAEMNRAGNTSFRVTGEGMRKAGRRQMSQTSERIKAGARESGSAMKYGTKGAIKGSGRGVIKGAVVGGATGGVGGAVAGATKEGIKGGIKGANAGRKNRTGSKEAFEQSLNESGLSKNSINQLKENFKEQGSKRFANKMGKANDDGDMTNETREQSIGRYQELKATEMANGIDESATGSDKYRNVVGNSNIPLSENLTADKNSLDEISGDHHLYDNSTKDELKQYSQSAGEQAKDYISTDDGKPAFTQEEIDKLSNAENENDFVDRLHQTRSGMEYAMQTENAHNMLQGSEFTDEDGNVSMNRIKKFQNQTNHAMKHGDTLSKGQLRDKALLDSAFVMGAKEKYRKPSEKFRDKIGSNKSGNYNQALAHKLGGSVVSRESKTNANKQTPKSAKQTKKTDIAQRKNSITRRTQQRKNNLGSRKNLNRKPSENARKAMKGNSISSSVVDSKRPTKAQPSKTKPVTSKTKATSTQPKTKQNTGNKMRNNIATNTKRPTKAQPSKTKPVTSKTKATSTQPKTKQNTGNKMRNNIATNTKRPTKAQPSKTKPVTSKTKATSTQPKTKQNTSNKMQNNNFSKQPSTKQKMPSNKNNSNTTKVRNTKGKSQNASVNRNSVSRKQSRTPKPPVNKVDNNMNSSRRKE